MALTPAQALDMLKSDDLLGLGFEADAVGHILAPAAARGLRNPMELILARMAARTA